MFFFEFGLRRWDGGREEEGGIGLEVPKNRFQESIQPDCVAWQFDNPIPTRFLAPIDCLKIPALAT